MFEMAKRDTIIGLREIAPILKWSMAFCIVIGISFFMLNPEKNLASIKSQEELTGNFGVCCSEIELSLKGFKRQIYENKTLMQLDYENKKIGSYIVFEKNLAQIQSNDQSFVDELNKQSKAYLETRLGIFELQQIHSAQNSENLVGNSLWIFVCLLTLIPIALSETMIGNDFRTGRLSELVCASGNASKLVLGKLIAVGSVTSLICLYAISIISSVIILLISGIITNNSDKLERIKEVYPNGIGDGNLSDISFLMIDIANNSGIIWLLAGGLILALQLSCIIMLVNLFSSNKSLKKSFIEKTVAALVWLPLLVPIHDSVSSYIPIFSIYDIATNIGPSFAPNATAICANTIYLGLILIAIIFVTKTKKEWPTAN